MTNGEGLIERAMKLREECRIGVQERGVMPDYVDACVRLNRMAPEMLTALSEQAKRIEVLEEALTNAMLALVCWEREARVAQGLRVSASPICPPG